MPSGRHTKSCKSQSYTYWPRWGVKIRTMMEVEVSVGRLRQIELLKMEMRKSDPTTQVLARVTPVMLLAVPPRQRHRGSLPDLLRKGPPQLEGVQMGGLCGSITPVQTTHITSGARLRILVWTTLQSVNRMSILIASVR